MNMTRKDYPSIGETLYSGELPNGLRICVLPKPGFSTCYAIFGTNYGGAMRKFEVDGTVTDTPAGVAHFLEHKMFDMPSGENALSVFSENGASPNAFTSSSYTCYYFSCTTGFEENLKLLLQFVSTPYFTEETVAKEQGIIGQEILMGEDSPGSAMYYNLLSLLYKNHPIRDRIAGTVESISRITDQTLYQCHKVFYAPSNMVLCVEGDVDPECVYRIALNELSSEKRSIPHADFGEEDEDIPFEHRIEVFMPVSEPQFLAGCRNIMQCSEKGTDDLWERMVGTISLRLLTGQSSPLFTRLYSNGTVSDAISGECDYAAGTSTVFIGAEGPDPDLFLSELFKETEDIGKNGIDPSYFERTLRASIGGQLKGYEDFDDTCVNLCISLLDGHNCLDAYDMLKNITKEDCERWITANIRPERMALSVVSPLKK